MISIYCGKSAAGKDYLFKKAIEELNLNPIVSATTRPIREGEIDGVDYFFCTVEEFLEKVDKGEIFEYRLYPTKVNGVPTVWYYGSPEVDSSGDYAVVLDLDGTFEYISHYGAENVRVFYVYADDDVRSARAKQRGSFSEEIWKERLKDDAKYTQDRINQLRFLLLENFIYVNNN